MNITRRTRAPWPSPFAIGLGLTAAIGLAGSALADSPTAKDGLMTFPNVSVETGTPNAKAPKAATSGMRAYVDPTTGTLRAQTQEEAQQVAAEGAAKTKAKVQAKGLARQSRTLAATDTTTEGLATNYGPGNTVGVMLDEEFLSYQVAHKTDAGLQVQEVTGAKAAKAAVKHAPKKVDAQEMTHER
jgi:hypothetical protein